MQTAEQILDRLKISRRGTSGNEFRTTCPGCSAGRRKKFVRCLAVKIDRDGVVWDCKHCENKGGEYFDGKSYKGSGRFSSFSKDKPRDFGQAARRKRYEVLS